MRMPTSTSRQMMVSVETTARGTTVLASISTAPTRPTRDSWLLLLPSRREEPDVRSLKEPETCASTICCSSEPNTAGHGMENWASLTGRQHCAPHPSLSVRFPLLRVIYSGSVALGLIGIYNSWILRVESELWVV